MTYKDNLPKRVPEFLQDEDTQLHEYLEACGEVFDEFSDTIKEHDVYKDYLKVPEARLSLLARRFAFSPPRTIPSPLMRGIVRDIAGIYTTKGVEQSITWVFRLIGWSTSIHYAWLLNPERYDPNVKTVYSELYERDGLENDASSLNTFFPRLDDGYVIGVANQAYQDDSSFVVDGDLLIGRNYLLSLTGDGRNIYSTDIDRVSVDFDKLDYRNFVYGEAKDRKTGTYFTGATYFSPRNNVKDAKIVGEIYKEEDIIKYNPSVLSTPYIVVKVDSEDYGRFTRPYVDENGVFYSYTDREKFRVAQTLIEYLLHEFVRPANVRIILIASVYNEEDYMNLNEDLSMEFFAEPSSFTESFSIDVQRTDNATVPQYYIGTDHFFIGMTSYVYGSGIMSLEPPTIGGSTANLQIQDIAPRFSYDYQNVPMVETATTGLFDSDEVSIIRTPSVFSVSTPKLAALYGKVIQSGDWEWIQNIPVGLSDFRVYDYTLIKVTNYDGTNTAVSDGLFDVDMYVTWEDRRDLGSYEWDFVSPSLYSLA